MKFSDNFRLNGKENNFDPENFKKLIVMKDMKMQFPRNHKHAVTSDGRIFVIGGMLNIINAIKHTYEIVENTKLIQKKSLNAQRHSFG